MTELCMRYKPAARDKKSTPPLFIFTDWALMLIVCVFFLSVSAEGPPSILAATYPELTGKMRTNYLLDDSS